MGTEEAEDAVQDISFKVLSAADIPDAFRPWLYKITRNHCLNVLRQRARHKDGQALPGVSQVYEALTGQLTQLVRNEARSKLAEMVQSLEESQRSAMRKLGRLMFPSVTKTNPQPRVPSNATS